MQLDMDDMKPHNVEIKGVSYQIRTGRVPNGWWWKCPGFDCDGAKLSREAALADAVAEITARSI